MGRAEFQNGPKIFDRTDFYRGPPVRLNFGGNRRNFGEISFHGLSTCAELYSIAVDDLEEAAKGIASGNAWGLQQALTHLSATVDAPETCEDGFRELNLKSPLVAEDAEDVMLLTLAVQ